MVLSQLSNIQKKQGLRRNPDSYIPEKDRIKFYEKAAELFSTAAARRQIGEGILQEGEKDIRNGIGLGKYEIEGESYTITAKPYHLGTSGYYKCILDKFDLAAEKDGKTISISSVVLKRVDSKESKNVQNNANRHIDMNMRDNDYSKKNRFTLRPASGYILNPEKCFFSEYAGEHLESAIKEGGSLLRTVQLAYALGASFDSIDDVLRKEWRSLFGPGENMQPTINSIRDTFLYPKEKYEAIEEEGKLIDEIGKILGRNIQEKKYEALKKLVDEYGEKISAGNSGEGAKEELEKYETLSNLLYSLKNVGSEAEKERYIKSTEGALRKNIEMYHNFSMGRIGDVIEGLHEEEQLILEYLKEIFPDINAADGVLNSENIDAVKKKADLCGNPSYRELIETFGNINAQKKARIKEKIEFEKSKEKISRIPEKAPTHEDIIDLNFANIRFTDYLDKNGNVETRVSFIDQYALHGHDEFSTRGSLFGIKKELEKRSEEMKLEGRNPEACELIDNVVKIQKKELERNNPWKEYQDIIEEFRGKYLLYLQVRSDYNREASRRKEKLKELKSAKQKDISPEVKYEEIKIKYIDNIKKSFEYTLDQIKKHVIPVERYNFKIRNGEQHKKVAVHKNEKGLPPDILVEEMKIAFEDEVIKELREKQGYEICEKKVELSLASREKVKDKDKQEFLYRAELSFSGLKSKIYRSSKDDGSEIMLPEVN